MGAVAPVHVELLAMRNTAEEHLVALRCAQILHFLNFVALLV
jgi:hypothetical protein